MTTFEFYTDRFGYSPEARAIVALSQGGSEIYDTKHEPVIVGGRRVGRIIPIPIGGRFSKAGGSIWPPCCRRSRNRY